MKKFIFLYVGHTDNQTPEMNEAWGKWFQSFGDKIVDSGNPFGGGKQVSSEGTAELPLDLASITGYTIIQAESLEEAEEIAKGCPSVSGVRVYEAVPM